MAHQQGSGRGLLDYTIEDLTHVWTETNDRTGRSSRKLPLASTLRPMNRALIRLKTRAASCNFGEWYSKFMLERLQGGLKTHAYDYTPGA